MSRKKKLIIGAVILAVAVGFLLFFTLRSYSVYYYTVSEALERVDSTQGETIGIGGTVLKDSLSRNGSEWTFALTDGKGVLRVIHEGSVPDSFAEGKDVMIKGKFLGDGFFHSSKILTKCPSKYSPKD
jgi:cytochrome c-type biogenesis protein CcmE